MAKQADQLRDAIEMGGAGSELAVAGAPLTADSAEAPREAAAPSREDILYKGRDREGPVARAAVLVLALIGVIGTLVIVLGGQ